MKRRYGPIAALLIVALLAGCATAGNWRDSAKKTVIASTQVYDLAMHIAGSSGMSAVRQAEVIKVANIYRSAAQGALAAADINDQAAFNVHIAELNAAITQLTTLINGGAH